MRVLTWFIKAEGKTERLNPAYYIESDYDVVAVRLHAVNAVDSDVEFDILDDGVSIFNDRASTRIDNYGRLSTDASATTAVLAKGDTTEEDAEDFNGNPIEKGSWVHCELKSPASGTFSVHLELEELSEDEPE